jgi:hypothetical protein
VQRTPRCHVNRVHQQCSHPRLEKDHQTDVRDTGHNTQESTAIGNHTRLSLRPQQVPTNLLHKIAQTHQRRRTYPDRLGRDKAVTDIQVPGANPQHQAKIEGADRDNQTKGNSHSAHAEQPRQLHLGRPIARHAQTVRSHCAPTDNIRLLHLVQRQP